MKSMIAIFALSFLSLDQVVASPVELCGQVVDVNIEQPGPNVPSGMRKFSGIWQGTIKDANKPCIAFVVEKIEQHGRALVKQAWAGVGQAEPKLAGTMTWIGQIKPESLLETASLILISPYVHYQLNVSYFDSASMSGFVVDPAGKFQAELSQVKK